MRHLHLMHVILQQRHIMLQRIRKTEHYDDTDLRSIHHLSHPLLLFVIPSFQLNRPASTVHRVLLHTTPMYSMAFFHRYNFDRYQSVGPCNYGSVPLYQVQYRTRLPRRCQFLNCSCKHIHHRVVQKCRRRPVLRETFGSMQKQLRRDWYSVQILPFRQLSERLDPATIVSHLFAPSKYPKQIW